MSAAKEELIQLIEKQPEDSSAEEITSRNPVLPYGETRVG